MKIKLTILLVIFSLSLFAQKRGKVKEPYKESLASVEPLYTYNLDSLLADKDSFIQPSFKPTSTINKKLEIVLDSIVSLNKNIKYIRGYKVLAYSGSSQEDALKIRKEILKSFEKEPDFGSIKTDFVWHQPTYRIYVGEYQKRLDAVRVSEYLRSYKFRFDNKEMTINPLVVPDKIKIRE